MCITFLMFNPSAGPDQWQLILISNRDEVYDRLTSTAAWKDGILAGRDLKEGTSVDGTWLGLTAAGRIGVLLNVTEPPSSRAPDLLSRGVLVNDFLKSDVHNPVSYAESLGRGEKYPGFTLLLLEKDKPSSWQAAYYSNRSDHLVEVLPPGVYGFSNSPRNKPYRKVQRGLQLFQQTLFKYLLTTDSDKWQFVDDLMRVLEDRTPCFPDAQLQSQASHLSRELQAKLSACFVEFPAMYKYGTRTHTVILIDSKDNVTFVERTMDEKDPKLPWLETKYEFQLKHDPSSAPNT